MELDADGAATAGDCYDSVTGLKVFIGMVALVRQNASAPVVISPASTMAGIGAIIGVSEAVRRHLQQLRSMNVRFLTALTCGHQHEAAAWRLCNMSVYQSAPYV